MDTKNILALRGIPVADTRISNIDGEKGKLIYRGYDILDLTKKSNFEETSISYLLHDDKLPSKIDIYEDLQSQSLLEARWIVQNKCK